MKYVMFEELKTGHHFPVLFPDEVAHKDVRVEGMRVTSAGEVNVKTYEALGCSASLKLQANPDDGMWLRACLMNNTAMLTLLNEGEVEMAKRYDHSLS